MTSEHKLCPVQLSENVSLMQKQKKRNYTWCLGATPVLRDAESLNVYHPTFWVAHFLKLGMNFHFSWAKYTWEMTNALVL